MTNPENNQNDSIDFDPNADYLKEVTEGGAGTSPSPETAVNAVFEQQIVANVAESANPAPNPVVEVEIDRVRSELGIGDVPQNRKTPTLEKQPDIEIVLRMMKNDRSEYERLIGVVHSAIEQYDVAVAQYGREDYRTIDKKKQWDYVVRVKDEQGAKIASWMAEYPEHKDIFKI